MADLTGAVWRKSTRSGDNGGDCVEVADNLPASSPYATARTRTAQHSPSPRRLESPSSTARSTTRPRASNGVPLRIRATG